MDCRRYKLIRFKIKVQNAAARLIFEQPTFYHITPVLSQLHWLPLRYRIEFKILLMTFKARHGARLSLKIDQPKKINWILSQIQQKSYA